MYWLQCFNINIRVDTALSIHNHISQQISLDDMQVDTLVELDNIRSIYRASRSKMFFHKRKLIIIRQNLVSHTRVLVDPCPGCEQVTILKVERIDLPCLPDLLRKRAEACSGYERCLFCSEGREWARYGVEDVEVEDDEEEEHAADVEGEASLHLGGDSVSKLGG